MSRPTSSGPGGRPRRERAGFTERVRQELALVPVEDDASARAELAVLVRCAGSLARIGDELGYRVETTSGAVARRVHALVQEVAEVRPALAVRTAGGVANRQSYLVSAPARPLGDVLGLLVDGSPAPSIPSEHLAVPTPGDAAIRGALLACGSISRPGRPAHGELAAGHHAVAEDLARLFEDVTGWHAGVSDGRTGARVVVKSRAGIGAMLLAAGATTAFLEWDEQGMRHDLRNEANRLANADAANLNRAVRAAGAQVSAVERAVELVGWDGLPDDLRTVALARLANPSASLSELGQLCDPPVGKSAVHRRLKRLEDIGRAAED